MRAADTRIVFTILLLTDVLKPVNMLSLYLQGDIGFFTNLEIRVKVCVDELHQIIQNYQQGDLQELEFRYSVTILNFLLLPQFLLMYSAADALTCIFMWEESIT